MVLIVETIHSQLEELENEYHQQVLRHDQALDEIYTDADGTPVTDPVLVESQIPHWHYQQGIAQFQREIELEPTEDTREALPDGGNTTQYIWYDPDTGTVLFDATVNGEQADVLFDTIDQASQFLERKAEENGEEDYTNLRLYRVRRESRYKEMEGVEAFSEQAGLMDF